MEIKNYKSGDERDILELFKFVFNKEMSLEYWKWRFMNTPVEKLMIKLMWENNILIGHYALYPVMLNVNGENILTSVAMSTMTHPDYAGRGILKKLAESLYKDQIELNGLKAVWGYPNNNAHYGLIKNLHWKNLEQIPTFSIGINKIQVSKQSLVTVVTVFDNNHIKAHNFLLKDYKVRVERSIKYLNWRYLENPINKYIIFGSKLDFGNAYAVTKIFPSFTDKGKFEVDILELIFPDDQELLLDLLNTIKLQYKNTELFKINVWLPLNDKKHIVMEKIGFTNNLPITYSGIRAFDGEYNDILQSNNWFYSMGDSDVY